MKRYIIEFGIGLDFHGQDVSKAAATEYNSKSAFLKDNAYKGAYNTGVFDKGDMVTVVISYLLEALSVSENADVVDKLLGTENITQAILSVFKGIISARTPIFQSMTLKRALS